MNKSLIKTKDNVRHISIIKKTASRICSAQVLYGASFIETDIDLIIKCYLDNYLETILIELGIKNIDTDLFKSITKGVYRNKLSIDDIISKHLSRLKGELRTTCWAFLIR